jgi:hypothetical protein
VIHETEDKQRLKGERCPLTRCVGPCTALVVPSRYRSSLHQPTITAKLGSEFIHQARFAPGWNFGEAQPDTTSSRWNCLEISRAIQLGFETPASKLQASVASIH